MDPELLTLVRQGKKIEAIKRYRELYGTDLKAAKDAVDALEAGSEVTPPAPAAAPSIGGAADDPVRAEIDALIRSGQKIEAIKVYREHYGGGLKEAKDAIDAWPQDSGRPAAALTKDPNVRVKSGCFIATAAFGTPMSPEVTLLRRYRDRVLCRSRSGRVATRLYYRLSPPLAQTIARRSAARAWVRALIRALLP